VKKLFTVGYGGRSPAELLECLVRNGVRAVVDVRLSPRGHMGSFTRAKSVDKGIQALLARGGIQYFWVEALGNPFRAEEEWRAPYRAHLESLGDTVLDSLGDIPEPYCLLCSEKRAADCHRLYIAERLELRGYEVDHL
jgi:uncharacterized protein (DUF488 family)